MLVENIIKAILIGLGASIPLGPIGIMCIQRTLSKGRSAGFALGLGASFSDAIYSAIALFSLAFIDSFLETNRLWVMLIGGVIIFFVGLKIAIKNPVKELNSQVAGGGKCLQDFLTGFLMTIANPGALVLMLGLFAYFDLNLGDSYKPYDVSLVLAGIFGGTALWWFSLSWAISRFRTKFRLSQIIKINRYSGIIIALLGILSVAEALFQLFIMK